MKLASKRLCRRLYALSGWDDRKLEHDWRYPSQPRFEMYPRYDLSFLIRSLPIGTRLTRVKAAQSGEIYWACDVTTDRRFNAASSVDGPEDAAAQLAIQLYEEGVLTRDGDE